MENEQVSGVVQQGGATDSQWKNTGELMKADGEIQNITKIDKHNSVIKF